MTRKLQLARNLYDVLLESMKDGGFKDASRVITDIIYGGEDERGEPIPDLRFTIRGFESVEDIANDVSIFIQLYRDGHWSEEIETTVGEGLIDTCPETGRLAECGEAVARGVTEQEVDDIVGYLKCS